jgi:hypothetical protein
MKQFWGIWGDVKHLPKSPNPPLKRRLSALEGEAEGRGKRILFTTREGKMSRKTSRKLIGLCLIAILISACSPMGQPTQIPPTVTPTPIPTNLPILFPTLAPTNTPEAVPAEELTKAELAFADGAVVYLYDLNPTTVSLSALDSTIFSLRFILSKEAKETVNLLLLWKVNAEGKREFIIPETQSMMMSETVHLWDWINGTGIIPFSTFSHMADTSTQTVNNPGEAVFTTWHITLNSVLPLYAAPNQIVNDPVYIEVLLLAPDNINGNLLISETSQQLSNTVRIEITP